MEEMKNVTSVAIEPIIKDIGDIRYTIERFISEDARCSLYEKFKNLIMADIEAEISK